MRLKGSGTSPGYCLGVHGRPNVKEADVRIEECNQQKLSKDGELVDGSTELWEFVGNADGTGLIRTSDDRCLQMKSEGGSIQDREVELESCQATKTEQTWTLSTNSSRFIQKVPAQDGYVSFCLSVKEKNPDSQVGSKVVARECHPSVKNQAQDWVIA